MSLFWKRKEIHSERNRYKITYLSRAGSTHISIIFARTDESARKQFMDYHSSPGDEITDIAIEPEEEGYKENLL